jgi:hypothetical protein
MNDIEDLLKELEGIKAKQKALAEREALCKADIMEAMQEDGLEKEESPYGTVRIQRRYEKDYGPEIRTMEEELKTAKKIKDDLGDYQIMGFKDSIVYTPPKELF